METMFSIDYANRMDRASFLLTLRIADAGDLNCLEPY